jgi:hypothetical protein
MSGPEAMRELTCDEVREIAGAYVLGALDATEDAAVRAHLAWHADAHPEIAELGAVIPSFVEVVPVVEPPEGLKTRIMAAAAAELAARGAAVAATWCRRAPAGPEAAPAAPAPRPRTVAFPTAESARPRARHDDRRLVLDRRGARDRAPRWLEPAASRPHLAARQYEQNVAAAPGRIPARSPDRQCSPPTADWVGIAAVEAEGDQRDAHLAPTTVRL